MAIALLPLRLGLLLLLGEAAAAKAGKSKQKQPSFLFILGDDIGWGDFGYNNGTSHTPNVDAWAKRDGTLVMQDLHSGGTVCSPTRGASPHCICL